MAYIVPSVRIFQEFGVSPLSLTPQLNAVIVGPNKKFLDYFRTDDKQTSFVGLYDNSIDNVVEYPGRDAGDVVDQSSVELRFDEVLADFDSRSDGETDALDPNVLRSGTAGFYFADSTSPDGTVYLKDSSLHNRGVKVGDRIHVTDGSNTLDSRVIGFKTDSVDPVIGGFTAGSLNHQAVNFVGVYTEPVVANTVDAATGDGLFGVSGLYKHPTEDTVYTVTCTVTGDLGTAVFDVSDSGTDFLVTNQIVTVLGQEEYNLGTRGLKLVLKDEAGAPGDSFTATDAWTVTCTAPANQNGVFEKSGAYTSNTDIQYTVTVVDKGVSGVARVLITTPNDEDNSGPVVVQEGIPFNIGSRGAQGKITFPSGGVLIPGDSWTIQCRGDGLGAVTETQAVAEADAMVLSGDYINDKDVVLVVTTDTVTNGNTFAAGVIFDWEMRVTGVDTTPADRYTILASGSITGTAGNDENTQFPLAFGVNASFTPDGGVFEDGHISTARLFSDGMELVQQGDVHDTVADAPSVVTLEAVGADANYATATLGTFTGAQAAGTVSSGGLYYSSDAGAYTVTVGVAGVLGVATYTVVHAGSDTPAAITTQAGVTRYYLGTRGLTLDFTSDFDSTGLTSFVATPVAKADMAVTTGYKFDNLLQYVVTCTTGGLIGVAEFSVTSTNGIDDVANFVSAAGENDIGTRGIKVTLDDASGTVPFIAGQSWSIDTALDARYTASLDNTYTLEVVRGGGFGVAEVRITSLLGDSSGPFVLQEDSRPRFRGQSLPLNIGNFKTLAVLTDTQRSTVSPDIAASFIEGDKWTLSPAAEVVLGLNGLILANTIPDALLDQVGLSYDVRLLLSDVLIPEEDESATANYTVDATTVTIRPAIIVNSPDVFDLVAGDPVPFDMPVESANMHVTYASLATAGTASLDSVNEVSEIEGKLGRIDPRNPLAYAVFKATQNSNIPIFFLRISEDTAIGYQAALDILELQDNVYALCPLTQDSEVIGAFQTHCDLMSTPDKGLWRICIVNQDLVTQQVILASREDILGNTLDLTATIVDDPNSADLDPPIFTKVIDPNGSFLTDGVTPGDLFLTDFVTNSPLAPQSSYEIDQVISDDTIILKSGPNAPVVVAQKYEIARPFTKDEQAANHAGIAESFGDHRVYLVWPDEVEADGQTVKGYHLAAAIAGMVAAFPPHQGFTNIGIAGFSAVPRTTEYFTVSQLNVMAAAGVYIVTQNASSGQIFARHQLSTDNTSIELRELSITKNFDALSYDFKAALEPYIGVWNLNDDAIGAVKATLLGRIEFQKAQKLPKIGAPLIDATINTIEQDPVLCDHLNIDVDLNIPCPLNNINLTLRV